MVDLSITAEPEFGFTWRDWKRLARDAERLGFTSLFRSDHFTVAPEPPHEDSLELIVTLAYLADRTRRVAFGPLVAPLSFRDPVMLARQAAALDELSGGRMVLGVGAGDFEYEHDMFGYRYGDVPERLERLAEGLEIIRRLLQDQGPVTYEGRFYRLRDAVLLPRSGRPGRPRILVGGNSAKRILPLVTRHADIWNAFWITPEAFQERSAVLDDMLRAAGRPPRAVSRTVTLFGVCGRSSAELERRVTWYRRWQPADAAKPLDALLDVLRTDFRALVGTPGAIVEQISAYAAAGVEEVVFHHCDPDDRDSLRLLAKEVLPHVRDVAPTLAI
jgi:F420-dependent oxidoreductase-like protein